MPDQNRYGFCRGRAPGKNHIGRSAGWNDVDRGGIKRAFLAVPGRIDIVSAVELKLYEDEPKIEGLTAIKRKIGEG